MQGRKLVKESRYKITSQCAPFYQSQTLIILVTRKSPEYTTSLFLRESLSTSEIPSGQASTPKRQVKHLEGDCMHNLAYFQKCFMRQMEEIKQFPKSSEQKFGELEMALSNISEKNRVNYIENSQLL